MRPTALRQGFAGALFALACLVAEPSAGAASEPVDLAKWSYGPLYDGLSAAQMIGRADVYDRDGKPVGEVQDFIVGPDGWIRKLVIEAGGFLDIGDTHFAYPLATAVIEGPDRVSVRFDKEKISSYSLFADIDDKPAKGRNWRLTELIGDYVHLLDRVRYGRVSDVVLSREGRIAAVVVHPDVAYVMRGPYALPFYGYEFGFKPSQAHYAIPHALDDVEKLDLFVRERVGRSSG